MTDVGGRGGKQLMVLWQQMVCSFMHLLCSNLADGAMPAAGTDLLFDFFCILALRGIAELLRF
jgi:hypothetical protein